MNSVKWNLQQNTLNSLLMMNLLQYFDENIQSKPVYNTL